MKRGGLGAGLLFLAGLGSAAALAGPPEPDAALAKRAYGLLEARCFSCHGADRKGGLDLRTRATALQGGTRGPALVPRRAAASLLYRLVAGDTQPAMPLGGHLSPAELALLKLWLDHGAPWPESWPPLSPPKLGGKGGASPGRPPSAVGSPRSHWSFQPVRRPAIPAVKNRVPFGRWVRTPVDAFVLAKLEAQGLQPSPEADPRTLIRRVSLDLTGLPPTPEEVDQFVAESESERLKLSPRTDKTGHIRTSVTSPTPYTLHPTPYPAAYERLVDRLLASPAYGERWAQHWLDVARYAETNGFELDADRPHAWRYRDWVVRAFNEDRPYDRFIREQLAGDELAPQDFDLRVATGFLRAGPQHVVGGNQDLAVNRQEWLTEAVNGVGSAFLGLTVGCARCHDHKFDPIPQADYYRLQAFFAATDNFDLKRDVPAEQEAYAAAVKAHAAKLKPIKDEIAALEQPYRERLRAEKLKTLEPKYVEALNVPADKRTPEQKRLAGAANVLLNIQWDELVAVLTPEDAGKRAAMRRRMHALDLEAPAPLPLANGVGETLQPTPPTHVLRRGDPHAPADEVQPGFPTVLTSDRSSAITGGQVGTAKDVGAATVGGRRSAVGAATVRLASTGAEPAPEGRRTTLAKWLASPENPLTARVMVNRVWQHHFGRGLVATPNDFGRHGALPTHPELLDWLAYTFTQPAVSHGGDGERERLRDRGTRASGTGPSGGNDRVKEGWRDRATETQDGLGWSLKRLHRLIVLSSTYRQSSSPIQSAKSADSSPFSALSRVSRANPQSVDPENRLLWRQNRQRLDAEALRDTILTVAGTLNRESGGPPVRVPLEKEVYDTIFTEGEPDNLWPVTPDPRQHTRRSLYLLRKRNVRLPMLAVFDAPDMMTSCGARAESVHALQSLTLMNSDFMHGQARALATRLLSEGGEPAVMIDRYYRRLISRPPTPRELAATLRFLQDDTALVRARLVRGEPVVRLEGLPAGTDPATAAAWVDLCLAGFNLNEVVYVR